MQGETKSTRDRTHACRRDKNTRERRGACRGACKEEGAFEAGRRMQMRAGACRKRAPACRERKGS
jgi:hypothetical protein